MKSVQFTLSIIKPHAVKMPRALYDIRNTIVSNNFFIIQTKEITLDKKLAEFFYHEHKNKFFYNRLVSLMTSGPSHIHILAKEDAVKCWRDLMGPTKVYVSQFSHPESLRGKHGLSDTRNAVHGSDSEESAAQEIEFFFPGFNIISCKESIVKSINNGSILFDKEKFIHQFTA